MEGIWLEESGQWCQCIRPQAQVTILQSLILTVTYYFHSPEILYNSVVSSPDRISKVKNTTLFYEDLKANTLPQWMFISKYIQASHFFSLHANILVAPNMVSDGHDSSVTVAGKWLFDFLNPLLEDENFIQNTLVLITFDENETYSIQNKVFSVLLGDSVPKELIGTTDNHYYNHYSEIATVEANWDLFTLGRWDVGANVFSHVAAKTEDRLRTWSTEPALSQRYFNHSYPGIFSSQKWAPQPVPDCHSRRNGRTTLPAIKDKWIKEQDKNYYHGQLEIPDSDFPPVYPYAY